MQSFTCPSCGAAIAFKSSVSVYAVCEYCASMVVRHDKDVEAIGKMAELPQDISPLQIGTEGVYRGVHFGLVGRAKIAWSDGSWNEWFLLVDDGRKGWLAEAQGFLAISFEKTDPVNPVEEDAFRKAVALYHGNSKPAMLRSTMPGLSPGAYFKLDGKFLQLTDIKEAECVGSEGELPFVARKGRKATYFDLLGPNREFGGVEESADALRFYSGEYVDFNALRLSNLRELEGWKPFSMNPQQEPV